MQQPLLPRCLSWSTFTCSTDSSSPCTPSWPSASGDPGENSLARAVSAAINSSLKAAGEAAPVQSCCVSGQQGLSPGTVGRKAAALTVAEAVCWGGWMHRGKGQQENCIISHAPDAWVQGGRDGFRALGAGLASLSHFGKEMKFTRGVHKVCICCQQGHGANVIHYDII